MEKMNYQNIFWLELNDQTEQTVLFFFSSITPLFMKVYKMMLSYIRVSL